MIPKSEKLAREQRVMPATAEETPPPLPKSPELEGPIKIRPVQCLNENVAVLLFRVQSTILLPDKDQHRNEGVVIGFGPGLPTEGGKRCPSQLTLGDVVAFLEKHIIIGVNPANGPYKGQRVIIINERSLLHKLPPVEFEVLEGEALK